VDYAEMKQEKDARYKAYCEKYADQLQLLGFIASLEKDIEHISIATVTTNREKRRQKKLIKINNKDIKKYNKMLSQMPPVPPFK